MSILEHIYSKVNEYLVGKAKSAMFILKKKIIRLLEVYSINIIFIILDFYLIIA